MGRRIGVPHKTGVLQAMYGKEGMFHVDMKYYEINNSFGSEMFKQVWHEDMFHTDLKYYKYDKKEYLIQSWNITMSV